jgi:hypothetical protein
MIIWNVAFFVEFFKYRFVMLQLQSPPLCSTVAAFIFLQREWGTSGAVPHRQNVQSNAEHKPRGQLFKSYPFFHIFQLSRNCVLTLSLAAIKKCIEWRL